MKLFKAPLNNIMNVILGFMVFFIIAILFSVIHNTVFAKQTQTNSLSSEVQAIDLESIRTVDLPIEAQDIIYLIKNQADRSEYDYPSRDGAVFYNRQLKLPKQTKGYYTEYTVKTPRAKNRGKRRIVAGGGEIANPAFHNEYYYTDDHYKTFKKVIED